MYAERVGLDRDFVIFDDNDQKHADERVLKDSASPTGSPRRARCCRHRRRQEPRRSARRLRGHGLLHRHRRARLSASIRSGSSERTASISAISSQDARAVRADAEIGASWREKFDHVLVDEFQDTNRVQYRLVHHSVERARTTCAWSATTTSRSTRWRGADLRNILDFERDHPGTRRRQARAELPLDADRSSTPPTRSSRKQPASASRSALFTEPGRRADPLSHGRGRARARRSSSSAPSASSSSTRAAPLDDFADLLSHPRAVARARRGAARRRHALHDHRRHALLRSRRGEGSARLPARDRQPRRRGLAGAHHQQADARHRRDHLSKSASRRRAPSGARCSRPCGKLPHHRWSSWPPSRRRSCTASWR